MLFGVKITIIPLDLIIIFSDDFGGHQHIDCIIDSPFNIALIFLNIGKIIDQDAGSVRILYFPVFFQQDLKFFGDGLEAFDLFLITFILRFGGDIIQIIFLHDLDVGEDFLQLVSWGRQDKFILLLILLMWLFLQLQHLLSYYKYVLSIILNQYTILEIPELPIL